MSWFMEFIQNGFGGLSGDAFEWFRAVGSIIGVLMFFGGLILMGINMFMGNSGIKGKISVKPVLIGFILMMVCGFTFGFHYFGIF